MVLSPQQAEAQLESEVMSAVIVPKPPHTADQQISAMDQDYLTCPTLMAG